MWLENLPWQLSCMWSDWSVVTFTFTLTVKLSTWSNLLLMVPVAIVFWDCTLINCVDRKTSLFTVLSASVYIFWTASQVSKWFKQISLLRSRWMSHQLFQTTCYLLLQSKRHCMCPKHGREAAWLFVELYRGSHMKCWVVEKGVRFPLRRTLNGFSRSH